MTESTTQPGQPETKQVQVHVREDKTQTIYSNVARLSTGPNAEELVLELATTTHSPDRQDVVYMDILTRVYLNFHAAKRLALTLSQAVQRYEQQFGQIELDPRKRLNKS